MGSRYTCFISTHYNFIENDKIDEDTLLNSSDDSLDPYDYNLSEIGLDCFKKLLECNQIHTSWHGKDCGLLEEIVEDEEDIEKDVEEDDHIQELE